MKPGNFALLSLIFENPGVTQTVLARTSGRDKSSVTSALRQLEDAGLVARTRQEDDRRSLECYVTAEGKATYQKIARKAQRHIGRLDDIVGQDRKPMFIEVLKDLAAALEEIEPGEKTSGG